MVESALGGSASISNGATAFMAALGRQNIAVEPIGAERCDRDFPSSLKALQCYSAIVISVVGALSLRISYETRRGLPGPIALRCYASGSSQKPAAPP